ncbi:DUF982 domain-containing protein [Mesorhizobium sp. B2-4-17]|uniref:DUF982 domain-containing protein n=1 Tax=Mesorhizobium sp. B2-4-17 TaxID=2589932 RepID=UPI001129BBEB|nr:DUF982 domain-containing protein [Mesorhizobium sp. B2-4-17]TPK91516.1 DUF982 domain-containing protein [Mesorhizobium sp. B2-4-17]
MLWFSPPVAVKSKQIGMTHMVSNVDAAAEELLIWDGRGPKWRAAVEACLAAKEGTGTADDARKAFLAAAKANGMLRASSV